MSEVSQFDTETRPLIRAHISMFFSCHISGHKLLEIGPETPHGAWDTLDILPGCTYQADITKPVPIPDATYDAVLAFEVLEHTVDPFAAVREIRRLLKPGGLLLASAPFNWRIHGPLPDCWRFSEHGWRVLLKDFDDVQFDILETPDRFLMPLHYCVSARCNKEKNVDPRTLEWRWIT